MLTVALLAASRAAGNVVLPLNVRLALVVSNSRSAPLNATLESVPPLDVITSVAPLATTLPPLIVPSDMFQFPVAGLSVSVLPVLFIVPSRLTVPPVREKPAKLNPPVLNVPPRPSVALSIESVPALLQLPAKLRVVPPAAAIEPGFDQFAELMLNVPRTAWIVPLFVVAVF